MRLDVPANTASRNPMETWVSPLRAPVPPGALCYVRGKGRVAAPAEPDRRVVPLVGRGKARALVLCAESNLFRDLARTQVAALDGIRPLIELLASTGGVQIQGEEASVRSEKCMPQRSLGGFVCSR